GDASTPQNGHMRPEQVAALLQQTADPTPCPADLTPYAPFPSTSNDAPQQCTGGAGYNDWYGKGIVNALNAVTHTSGGSNPYHALDRSRREVGGTCPSNWRSGRPLVP